MDLMGSDGWRKFRSGPAASCCIDKEQGWSHGHASRWPILTQIPTDIQNGSTTNEKFDGSKRPTKSLVEYVLTIHTGFNKQKKIKQDRNAPFAFTFPFGDTFWWRHIKWANSFPPNTKKKLLKTMAGPNQTFHPGPRKRAVKSVQRPWVWHPQACSCGCMPRSSQFSLRFTLPKRRAPPQS